MSACLPPNRHHGTLLGLVIALCPSIAAAHSDPACGEHSAAMASALEPVAKVKAGLAAARCHLVTASTRPMSRLLLGGEIDRKATQTCLREGMRCLRFAEEAFKTVPEDFDPAVTRELEDRLDMLRAFGNMFIALASETQAEARRSRLIDACIELSIYVDDPNPGIAESARLWQGVANRQAGRSQRALKLLSPAVHPSPASRAGFLLRVERCKALADEGRYVASLAVGLQIAARLDAWFSKDALQARKQAAATIQRVRVETMNLWAESLKAKGKKGQAEAIAADAQKLTRVHGLTGSLDEQLQLDGAISGLAAWDAGAEAG